MSVGFKASVKDYRLTYYTLDYVTKNIDILAELFKVSSYSRVPPKQVGVVVAMKFFTSAWTTV